jgi:endoglucanase
MAEAASGFRRGATLVEFFMFPLTAGEGAAKTYTDAPYRSTQAALQKFNFADLRAVGFDHVRIPVDVGPLMAGDEARRVDFLHRLRAVVTEIHRHGLAAIVTLHPPSLQRELPETWLDDIAGPRYRDYLAVVERIAGELATITSGRVALEPMNEPQDACRRKNGTDWTLFQEHMIARIRTFAPDLPLFLTGGCWSNIEGIVLLDTDLLRDHRNLVTVHFYYPFLFTHQSATWSMPYLRGVVGVPYPASAGSLDMTLSLTREQFRNMALPAEVNGTLAKLKAEREIQKYFYETQGSANIAQWMQRIADWQKRQRVDAGRIVFTEFGAMKQKLNGVEIDKASRARWLHDTSAEIERHGWGWTVYVLRDDPFGLYAHMTDRYPDPELLRALRLNVPE